MLLLPYLIPSNGKYKCQQTTVNQILIRYKDVALEDIRRELASRNRDANQPVIVKLETGDGDDKTEEFFIAFDGVLVLTLGDATRALLMLCCSYYIFWLNYPPALTSFFAFMESTLGIQGGLGVSGALHEFMYDLKHPKANGVLAGDEDSEDDDDAY